MCVGYVLVFRAVVPKQMKRRHSAQYCVQMIDNDVVSPVPAGITGSMFHKVDNLQNGGASALMGAGGNLRRRRDKRELFDIAPKLSDQTWLRNLFSEYFLFDDISLEEVDEFVSTMTRTECRRGQIIVEEGGSGDHLYVIQEGALAVTQASVSKVADVLHAGRICGEIGFLFQGSHAASVVVESETAVLWILKREDVSEAAHKTMLKNINRRIEFLEKCPEFANLKIHKLRRLAALMQEERFKKGDIICKEGEVLIDGVNDKFYSIGVGCVRVSMAIGDSGEERELVTLQQGTWFGEMSLLNNTPRSATCTAWSDTTMCYTLSKSAFIQVVSTTNRTIRGIATHSELRNQEASEQLLRNERDKGAESLMLDTLIKHHVIGEGGFSVVRLVEERVTHRSYALKIMNKQDLTVRNQQEHVNNEREILSASSHPFILSLIKTFQDRDRLFMLLELVQGGELFSRVIQSSGGLPVSHVRFYSACVTEGIAYLHRKHVVYRDLKLENLVIASDGYLKIIDFGFAKRLLPGERTTTLCGTPDYLAPEAVTREGHTYPIDVWAIGVLIYEMLTQCSPFADTSGNNSQVAVFEKILLGHSQVDWSQLRRVFRSAEQLNIARHMLERLWDRDPNTRSTATALKHHPFFMQSISWAALRYKKFKPPWKPQISGPLDTQYFDVEAFSGVHESTKSYDNSNRVFAHW